MKDLTVKVLNNREIAQGVHMLTFSLPESVGHIRGGQFVNLSAGDGARLLRRPLGVCKTDGKSVSVCFQIKGSGTKLLAQAKAGDELKALLPLGNGFNIDGFKNVAVIGGGVGIFPLVATIAEHCKNVNFYSYIGFRNKGAVCLIDELGASKKLTVVTDDGSFGKQGNAVDAFLSDVQSEKLDAIIACGPGAMFRALKHKLAESAIKIPCYVSLEERMGCGLGACLVCACKKSNGENARVCKDGPVFEINEIEL